MSRIGKEPIPLPKGVKVSIDGDRFTAEGPKGKVSERILEGIEVGTQDDVLEVRRTNDSRDLRAKHGLVRSLLANAVEGVANGFKKELEINGVGYRAEVQGKAVQFALGYSHPIRFPIPDGIAIEIDKNNRMTVSGANRQQVGQVAANIRGLRPPEPYKGKGIKYVDEQVRRKVGKAGAK